MKTVFADTLYWVAVFRPGDPWQTAANQARRELGEVYLLTTDEVLSEFLNFMRNGGPHLRREAVKGVRAILQSAKVKVVVQSRESLLRAMARYDARADKQYSLTDCSSMNAMDAKGIKEVLSNDHHFVQEGYVALMKR